jgi:hypothetical protein
MEKKQGTADLEFVKTLVNMRNGALAVQLGEDLQKLVLAVCKTAKKGKLQLTLEVIPSRCDENGVIEVDVSPQIKLTEPRLSPGKAIFFPLPDGTLSRNDPAQMTFFEGDKQ